ncbi:MAG: hypothetical protein ACRDIC_12560 [bacterium]
MGRRIGQVMLNAWIGVGITLLILSLLEGVTRVGIAARARWTSAAVPAAADVLPVADAAPLPAWAAEYNREDEDSSQVEWRPYVYWRRKPYRGTYINVNAAGIRRTWNRTASASPTQLKIAMLGGSMMWGMGARDEFTIPSLVSKKLPGRLSPGVWVTNFAEIGYVSTQEVIGLVRELQSGHVPDVVVFLDGVNDTGAAFQSGVASIPYGEQNRTTEFNSRTRLNFVEGFLKHLALYRLSQRTTGFVRGQRFEHAPLLRAGISNDVVAAYLWNVAIVTALANDFGFRAFFFWQPTVFSKKRLSPWEHRVAERFQRRYPTAVPFYNDVYRILGERVRTGSPANVYDLSSVFDEEPGTMFFDPIHLLEEGNDKIADAIVQALLKAGPLERR